MHVLEGNFFTHFSSEDGPCVFVDNPYRERVTKTENFIHTQI